MDLKILFLCFLFAPNFILLSQNNDSAEAHKGNSQKEVWHVKAFDSAGTKYDVKALEDAHQRYIMDVKAFVGEEKLPVKVLVSEEQYKPIVAISESGKTYQLMAIAKNGDLLQVRGVRKSGYIVHIKAIGKDGVFYGVKAISQKGKLNDVKGIKMYDKRLEVTLNGVEVHAHVVALPQIQ